MALILKSAYRRWYEKNKQAVSEKRKKRYAQDPAYRQRAVEASRRRRRGESTARTRPEGLISFKETPERIGVSGSALHGWRRQKLFPETKHYGGQLWFSQQQVLLLKHLKNAVYGRRRWYMKSDRFKEVIAYVKDNWD